MRLAAALALAALLWPSDTAGQALCGKRAEMVAQLEDRHNEHRVAFAITSAGWILEIFATSSGDTWTTLLTDAHGKTCLVGSGIGWRLDLSRPGGTAL